MSKPNQGTPLFKIIQQLDLGNPDYTVVACGYTGRLIKHYLTLGAQIKVTIAHEEINKLTWIKKVAKQDYILSDAIVDNAYLPCSEHSCSKGCNNNWGTSYQNEYDDDYEAQEYNEILDDEHLSFLPLSIYDYLDGDGLYLFSDNNNSEALEVNEVLKQANESRDLIFKGLSYNKSTRIIELIQKLGHCACFRGSPYKSSFIEFINAKGEKKTILILNYDTESG